MILNGATPRALGTSTTTELEGLSHSSPQGCGCRREPQNCAKGALDEIGRRRASSVRLCFGQQRRDCRIRRRSSGCGLTQVLVDRLPADPVPPRQYRFRNTGRRAGNQFRCLFGGDPFQIFALPITVNMWIGQFLPLKRPRRPPSGSCWMPCPSRICSRTRLPTGQTRCATTVRSWSNLSPAGFPEL
jgi:hypothetical protein